MSRCAEAAEPDLLESVLEQIAAFIREALREELGGLRLAALPERPPEHVLAAARVIGALERPEPLLGVYRHSQIVLWSAWFDLVEGKAWLGGTCRRELLRHGSDFFFAYSDRLSQFLAVACREERDQRGHGSERRRLEAIKGLLADDPDAASTIDLDLGRHHLALIAWGDDPRAAVAGLADALGRPFVLVCPDRRRGDCWAWISGTRPLAAPDRSRLRSLVPRSASVALGREGSGAEGFRTSHRQALRAARFAPRQGPSITHYASVVVEALASENEEDARAFVAQELRGIEDDSLASRRIRQTLAAYFAAQCNAASAAAALGVHQQTVANRLRVAEQRLGRTSIGTRRLELEMALRLRPVLSASEQR